MTRNLEFVALLMTLTRAVVQWRDTSLKKLIPAYYLDDHR